MRKAPEISVIMSVYNGEKYIREAVKSILFQTFWNWELIIVDDCSSDRTGATLKLYEELDDRIRIVTNEKNLKLQASLNKAISLARGKYIARMDADDMALPERLEKQYAFMEENPDTALSSCRYMTFTDGVMSSGGGGSRGDCESVKALLLVTNPILHPGVIIRNSVLRELEYDTDFTCTEDLELWSRMAKKNYKMAIQDEYLMIYRIHKKQITGTTMKKQYEEVMKVQDKFCPEIFKTMSQTERRFYIHGIYFREEADINGFCEFFRHVKSVNGELEIFDAEAIDYAALEILAEYRRNGISLGKILKAIPCFGSGFLIKELFARKRRARADGIKCIQAAEKIGFKYSGGNVVFPKFSKSNW